MYKATYKKYILKFKQPSGTSRGILTEKTTYFIKVWEEMNPSIIGTGECCFLKGLSIDNVGNYEDFLADVCVSIDDYACDYNRLTNFPSICFGVETALRDLKNGGKRILFPSSFTQGEKGILINGLIWIGDIEYMRKQLKTKIEEGFRCIKIKIGAMEFQEELKLLSELRTQYSERDLEIRLDANGAFRNSDALQKLEKLSKFKIHSIEQPIRQGNWDEMAKLCRESPIPIALDEELIGVTDFKEKEKLISQILPQYLIFKPSLLGGFNQTEDWIKLANKYKIGWWVTSALESNIGLNAIAQWTFTLSNKLPQGLGTGQLYTNNISSPLKVENSQLWYNRGNWNTQEIE